MPVDGEDLPISGDIHDLLNLLKNLQQSISAKVADYDLKNFEEKETVLRVLLPLGFSQAKRVVHNLSVVLNKLFANEDLQLLEFKENALLFNLMITMLNYWVTDLVPNDNFLLNAITELLEVMTKSGKRLDGYSWVLFA